MRLFFQLSEPEQNEVLHHCADIVIQDMIVEGVHLDPITEEELDLKEKLEDAVKHIQDYPTKEEKINYLLGDSTVSKAIYDIALEMAKSAFYHEEEELVIFPSTLKQPHEEPELLLPEAPKPKKISPLN